MSLDCVIYCAFYSILFRGGPFFSRTRCIASMKARLNVTLLELSVYVTCILLLSLTAFSNFLNCRRAFFQFAAILLIISKTELGYLQRALEVSYFMRYINSRRILTYNELYHMDGYLLTNLCARAVVFLPVNCVFT